MSSPVPDRDTLALEYIEQLPWTPYPFQEEAIYAWFSETRGGLLICAPTGTGKTVIAEGALFEALKTGRRAYYTTPLIALTEQKFEELCVAAERWGFSADDVGLITGNRKVNPEAPVLVVVAEILLNRLLDPDDHSIRDVSAVVMDEFHSFNDPERGIVWELSLGLLPESCRVLLLSATVGNAVDFVLWLKSAYGRAVRLMQSDERRVPLSFQWVPDQMLFEQLEIMIDEDEDARRTPALVFCFNRNDCWSIAEQLKGKRLLTEGQQKQLQDEIERMDWSLGAGGKLKPILMRGVGIHHAGLLPVYRRRVERLFQKKLLSVCLCTETLAAGINLPARSVVLTTLLKGPPRDLKLIDPSSAHQMFGRAGRPQFDDQGFVYAIAHEDDVRHFRWKERYDQIPEDTKDPMLLRAKKNLKKKMPKRQEGMQYSSEKQFAQLQAAAPRNLASHGRLPWRLMAWLIQRSPDVNELRATVRRRMLNDKQKHEALMSLHQMLLTLEAGGFVTLQPQPERTADAGAPLPLTDGIRMAGDTSLIDDLRVGAIKSHFWTPRADGFVGFKDSAVEAFDPASARDADFEASFGGGVFDQDEDVVAADDSDDIPEVSNEAPEPEESSEARSAGHGLLGQLIQEARDSGEVAQAGHSKKKKKKTAQGSVGENSGVDLTDGEPVAAYEFFQRVYPNEQLNLVYSFRSVNPIYALFVAQNLHRGDRAERLMLLESLLALPRSVAYYVRVPFADKMPRGPMETEWLVPLVLSRGLATKEEIEGYRDEETGRRIPPIAMADQMRLLFRSEFPSVDLPPMTAVWCAGELLRYGGDFNRFVRAADATKQEGILFRHLLRLILLCGEFALIEPPGFDPRDWRAELSELAVRLTESCRRIDPKSTDETFRRMETEQL